MQLLDELFPVIGLLVLRLMSRPDQVRVSQPCCSEPSGRLHLRRVSQQGNPSRAELRSLLPPPGSPEGWDARYKSRLPPYRTV